MGLMDYLSEGKALVNKAVGSAKTKMHRKYVWNDFSVGIQKAQLKILSPLPDAAVMTKFDPSVTLNLEHTLSVQLNPEHFDFSYNIESTVPVPSIEKNGDNNSPAPTAINYSNINGDLTIPLIYDIYDEFMARTGNESYPELTGFSLVDASATSLPMLIEDVTSVGKYGMLVWGEIRQFGFLKGIDVHYTAFSRWGQPLKANVDLRIAPIPLPPGKEPNFKDDVSSNVDKAKNVAGNVAAFAKNIFR